jgi:ribosomal protein S18 acetylase RimI-like enzyme
MTIREATSAADVELVRELVFEYTRSLGADFDSFNFAYEMVNFPGEYIPPSGCLLLAVEDGQAAGCAALRDLRGCVCEMKRMYVRPAFRGRDLGRALAVTLIERARAAGYESMRLDTLPKMTEALALYRSLGFAVIEPYRPAPFEDSLFMELDLRARPAKPVG